MIQILTLIQFAFPFLLLTAFFCLYRKEYGFMKRFMWKLTMFQSARNLYAYLVVLMLIFINWCCHVTTPNLSVVVSITPDSGAAQQENRRKHLPSFA